MLQYSNIRRESSPSLFSAPLKSYKQNICYKLLIVIVITIFFVGESSLATTSTIKTENSSEQSSEARANLHADIPYVFQGKGNSYCGPTVFITALQAETGLNLTDPKLIPQIAGLVNREIQNGTVGCRPMLLMPYFRMNFEGNDFNSELKLTNRDEAKPLALKIIREKLIPSIRAGSYYHLQIHNGSAGHAILLTDYDDKEDKFVVYDPYRQEKILLKPEAIAEIWPVIFPEAIRKKYNYVREDRVYLRSDKIDTAQKTTFTDPPINCEVLVDASQLRQFVINKEIKIIPQNGYELKKNVEGAAYWQQLSKYWEKDRTAEEAPGYATLVKIKAAQGDPILVIYSKDEGNYSISAVTGYKGGIANPDAQIQLSTCVNGEISSKWISSQEFNNKCFHKDINGKLNAFVGFPTISIILK